MQGLSAENTYESVTFGKAPGKKSTSKSPRGGAAPVQRHAGVSMKAIKKKKKEPRGAGLMKLAAEPVPEPEEDVESVASPYIVDSKNPFGVLGDDMMTDEPSAAKPVAAKKNIVEVVAEAASETIKAVGSTPVARRTRTAFKSISNTMSGVVAAIVNSPAHFAAMANKPAPAEPAEKPEVKAPAKSVTKPAAKPPVAKAKATAAPAMVADNAPTRRSSRLRPVAA